MTRRQFLAAGAAWLGAGVVPGAWSQPRGANPPRELRLALAGEPGTADPHFAAITPNVNLAQHLFDALVHVDAGGAYVPGLAASWRAVDPVTWEIKLRPDVMFHDGSRMTMEDVLFSLQRPGRITGSPAPLTTFSRQILATKVIDAATLQIKTREPYGGLPGDLSSIFIVSRAAAEAAQPADFDSGKAAVGTGPFRLRGWTKGSSITLERHEAYWAGAAPWARATLLFMPDEKQRMAALAAGQVDAVEGVPPADVPGLRSRRTLQLVQCTSWRTVFLHVEQFTDRSPWITDNAGRPLEISPLKDRRVRHALSLALNRPAMVHGHLEGLAEPAGQLVAPGVLGYSGLLKPEAFDLAAAKRLMAEAGLPDGFALTLHGPKGRYIYDEAICRSVAEQWGRLGVRTRVEVMPAAQYFPRARQGEFSVAMLGYGSLAADFALRALLGTPDSVKGWGTWNWSKYSSNKLDAALRESLRSTEPGQRQRQAAAAMEIAMGDRAVVPLHHQFASWAMRPGLSYAGRIDEFTLAHQFRPA
jgi:peptide/nickel transport system substrate-binding protein